MLPGVELQSFFFWHSILHLGAVQVGAVQAEGA